SSTAISQEVMALVTAADSLRGQAESLDNQLVLLEGQLNGFGQGSGSASGSVSAALGMQVMALANQADHLLNQAQTVDHQTCFLEGQLNAFGQGSGSGSGSGSSSTMILAEVTALATQGDTLVNQALGVDQQLVFLEGQLNAFGQSGTSST